MKDPAEPRISIAASVAKTTLRQSIRSVRENLTAEERGQLSAQVCALIHRQPAWQAANVVLAYAPMADELDIWPLLRELLEREGRLALPRFNPTTGEYEAAEVTDLDTQLEVKRYKIHEPVSLCRRLDVNRLDFILVPGVAYDLDGHRLGHGKGFYDRLLASVRFGLCGVATDEQVVPSVPVEPHDITVNWIATPTRWLVCGQRVVPK